MPDFDWERLDDAWDEYTWQVFPYIRPARLITAVFGSVLLAVTSGIADVIYAYFEAFVLLPVTGIISFIDRTLLRLLIGGDAVEMIANFSPFQVSTSLLPRLTVGNATGGILGAAELAFTQSARFIARLGLFGFIAAVGIVLLAWYSLQFWRE